MGIIQQTYMHASLTRMHNPPPCSPLVADVKIAKLMRLLKGDQKGRADLQRAHELIRAVVQHGPSRPPLDAAARTPLQVPFPAVVRCTCSTGSTALWLCTSSANDLMKPDACPLQRCRCAVLMHLQARTAQLQGAPAAVVADAPIRINLPHAVWAWPATVWHVLTLLDSLPRVRQFLHKPLRLMSATGCMS